MVCWRLWRKVGVGADAGAVEAEGADTAPALSLMVVDRLGKELQRLGLLLDQGLAPSYQSFEEEKKASKLQNPLRSDLAATPSWSLFLDAQG